ncbi:hypothetical protein, partial [Pseudomonas chlororaphis]|uniref:hypothetical protein n=1 Tax=Pseudomonas chlororaphis TaxID=587753 RepID=UPI0031F57C29|nr:hypothetical protein [Pseudomonas chlororaphis]
MSSATGNKIDLKNSDGNIVVSKTAGNNDVTFDLANDLAVDSVTLGGTTLNSSGLTIGGGPSVTMAGINAAGTVITNVAPGGISATSTDAINGSQLNTTNQNVAQNTTNITSLDGRVTTVEGDVTTLQSGLQNLADTPITFTGNSGSVMRKLGEALGLTGLGSTAGTYSGSNLKTEVDSTTGEVKLQMAENPEFTSVVTGNTTLNSSGLTISGGPSVTTTGINAAGTTISNVTAGVSGTDAVNVNQLNAVNTVAGAGWDVTAQGSNSSNVGVGSATGNKIDLKNSDGNIVVSKAAGNNDVTFDLANDLTADSVTLGNTTVNTNGLTISGGPSVTTAGINAAGTVISNVAAGSINATSTDAINGSQLNTTNQNVAQNTTNITSLDGRVTTVEGDVTTLQSGLQNLADTPITFTGNNGSVMRKLGEALGLTGLGSTAGTYSGSNLRTEVDPTSGEVKLQMAENPAFTSVVTGNTTLNTTGLTISGGPSITTTGINAAGTTITNVAAGVSGTDAVNVNQLNAVNTVAGAGWDVTAQGSNSSNVGASSATGNKIDLKNSDGNIVVSKTAGNNDVTFDLANNLAVDSVTLGNTTVNTNGLTISGGPSITTAGINAAGTTISNVAAGVNGTDAVNVNQLNAVNTVAGAGWDVTAQGSNSSNVGVSSATGNKIDLKNSDGNIVVSKTAGNNDVTFDLADAIKVDSINAAGSQLNGSGLTVGSTLITNSGLSFSNSSVGVSGSGINAGGMIITHV